jgi:purine-binding chemotaxis protein CheW
MPKEQIDLTLKEGKYLTFALGKEEYGVEILQVREIIGLMEITAVPQVPAYVRGVINLRGKVIPVIDLRLKFTMPEVAYTTETCIIVLTVQDTLMGVIVDRVCEVHDIHSGDIEAAPDFGARISTDFLIGMGKIGDKVVLMLNIERVLTEDMVLIEQQ